MTVWTDNAAAFAARNRAAHADLILSVAVSEAAALIRSGDRWAAERRLARAQVSAGRILGSTS